jgi:L-cysteine:1D-myo-inositol 2-amino-2-deoxy-alpha-D-glucopyranoside ligase
MLPIANERGNNPNDPHKQDPLDFVVWQAQAPGEPAWQSPWGAGRPGWHIECSTMATSLLGNTVDIHGGGADLIFPHHESEIPQAEAATGQKPFVRFWMHTAMVRHEGEKMSKSLGNLVMANDLLNTYSPDALRYYLANHHYRETWSYSQAELEETGRLVSKLREAVGATDGNGPVLDPSAAVAAFRSAMDEDLNSLAALKVLQRLAAEITDAALAGHSVDEAQERLRTLGSVFGLRFDRQEPEGRVTDGWNRHRVRFTNAPL